MKLPSPWKLTTPHFVTAALTLCNGPYSVRGVCFYVNEPTSYLPLYLSLNSFCNETSRFWDSLGPEARSEISVGRPCVLAGFDSQPHGLGYSSEVSGFRDTQKKLQEKSPKKKEEKCLKETCARWVYMMQRIVWREFSLTSDIRQ